MRRIDGETETLLPVRRQGGVFDDVAHTLRGDGFDASEDGGGKGTPLIVVDYTNGILGDVSSTLEHAQYKGNCGHGVLAFDTTQITSKTNRCQPQPGDGCHPLAAGAHVPAIAFSAKDHGGDAEFECSSTLRAGGFTGSHANAGVMPAIAQGWAVRRLMPIECERLQAFPDGYTFVPFRGKPAADGPRYKALGNSMAVNVMRWIGFRIDLVNALVRNASSLPVCIA